MADASSLSKPQNKAPTEKTDYVSTSSNLQLDRIILSTDANVNDNAASKLNWKPGLD